MTATDYRNNFCKIGDDYMQMMDADDFLNDIEIISNLNNSNWNHGQRVADHLRYYTRSSTWKTDCLKCKKKCHEKNELTSCEKAKKYVEKNGINLNNATEKQIISIKLPSECICKEQVQMCCYI